MALDETNGFKLRYVGARFSGPRLPFDVLGDLPALRDLLAAFAEEDWRAANPSRQRVPKGFDKLLSFSLTGVEDGSAMPAISWDPIVTQPALPGLQSQAELVRLAHNQVIDLFDRAGQGRFPDVLSASQLRALNRFGAALKDNERIEFFGSQGTDGNVVFLDSERRKRLITHVKDTYEKRVEGIGRLVGNFEDGALTLRSDVFGDFRVPVDQNLVIKTFDGNLGATVFYDLVAELDNNDRLRGVRRVEDVRLIDDEVESGIERCDQRLSDLSSLTDGWHDGDGYQIASAAIANARSFLHRRPDHSSNFRIYPTLEKGVQFEFVANGWDFSVEFLSDGSVEFFGVAIDGSEEIEPITFESIGDEFYGEFDRNVKDARVRS